LILVSDRAARACWCSHIACFSVTSDVRCSRTVPPTARIISRKFRCCLIPVATDNRLGNTQCTSLKRYVRPRAMVLHWCAPTTVDLCSRRGISDVLLLCCKQYSIHVNGNITQDQYLEIPGLLDPYFTLLYRVRTIKLKVFCPVLGYVNSFFIC
jgi:hypothetical protein